MAMLIGDDIPAVESVAYDYVISKWKGPRLRRLRHRFVFRRHLGGIGSGASISHDCKLISPGRIVIGARSWVANTTILDGRGSIEIGENCRVGFQNVILSETHAYDRSDVPVASQGMVSAPVRLGDDVWTGVRVTILPGVTIGDHAIIGAHSVVTNDIPANSIAGGTPAKVIRARD